MGKLNWLTMYRRYSIVKKKIEGDVFIWDIKV